MNQWLEVKEVAQILNTTERTIQRQIKNGKLKAKKVPQPTYPGYSYKVDFNSLPFEAQKKYLIKHRPNPNEETPVLRRTEVSLDNFPKRLRDEAYRRLEILEEFRLFQSKTGLKKVEAIKQFVNNNGSKISQPTLYRWLEAYKKLGIVGLIPAVGKNQRNYKDKKIDKEAEAFLKLCYLNQNKPTIKQCYRMLQIKAGEKGWVIPSYEAVRKILKSIPKPVQIYYREGEKAFDDKCAPAILRDYNSINSNDWWSSDHHQLDVCCKLGTKIIFPWLTVWIDLRSRKVLSFMLSERPNQDVINCSLRQAILNHGIPNEVLIDNGKDYTSKLFASGHKRFKLTVNENEIKGIYKQLEITPHFALPYNAKAKPAERLFRTLEEQFGKALPGYRGSHTKERPEKLKNEIKKGDIFSFEALEKLLINYIYKVYNQAPHQGHSMDGKSPNQVYEENLYEKRIAREESLRLLMMKSQTVQVRRQGIWLLKTWYRSEELFSFLGQKVIARYDPQEIGRIFVYTIDDEFICEAKQIRRLQFGATADDYKKLMKDKKQVKKLAKEYYKKQEEIQKAPTVEDRALLSKFSEIEKIQPPPPTPSPKILRIQPTKFDKIPANQLKQKKEEKLSQIGEQFFENFLNSTPQTTQNLVENAINNIIEREKREKEEEKRRQEQIEKTILSYCNKRLKEMNNKLKFDFKEEKCLS
jgi:transposase InsO family protein